MKCLPGTVKQMQQPHRAPSFDLHGGGLAGSVVSQEGGDLTLVEVDAEVVDSHLLPCPVDLVQVTNGGTQLQMGRLPLKVRVL